MNLVRVTHLHSHISMYQLIIYKELSKRKEIINLKESTELLFNCLIEIYIQIELILTISFSDADQNQHMHQTHYSTK